MTRSKLSDLEKQEIVSNFEQQQATIPDLAERYQVSSSTIRRLLKQFVSESSATAEPVVEAPFVAISSEVGSAPVLVVDTVPDKKPKPLTKRAAAAQAPQQESLALESTLSTEVEEPRGVTPPTLKGGREDLQENRSLPPVRSSRSPDTVGQDSLGIDPQTIATPRPERVAPPQLRSITPPQEEMSAILEDLSHGGSSFPNTVPEDEEDDDEDEDEFDDEDYDRDDDDDDSLLTGQSLQLQPEVLVEVIPFDQAVLPKICYLVVDRTAELVTRPLKDFGELGQIPDHEVQSCTLPIFDNHRIARRFSHRNQRIIKVPNGNMLRSTAPQLSAKGITRLLINGRIYAL